MAVARGSRRKPRRPASAAPDDGVLKPEWVKRARAAARQAAIKQVAIKQVVIN